jgi:purine-nucleoside phosphorylase
MPAMSTHIGAEPGQIADRVLLPGDPLRAQWIAQTYLSDVICYSTVRNMLGFTGMYDGIPVSVQGTGMGQPSLSIYVHELIAEYGVRTLVRVGSCGGMRPEVKVRDLVVAMSASTDSAMNRHRFEGIDFAPTADFDLLCALVEQCRATDSDVHVGQVATWDVFYADRPELRERLTDYGVLAVEMETSALYTLAAKHGARAAAVCTVSDSLVTQEETSAQERERTFSTMVQAALRAVTQIG